MNKRAGGKPVTRLLNYFSAIFEWAIVWKAHVLSVPWPANNTDLTILSLPLFSFNALAAEKRGTTDQIPALLETLPWNENRLEIC